MKPLSVLYIHHSGIYGGASKSLLELINAFPDNSINPTLLAPAGSIVNVFRENGIRVEITRGIFYFDHSRYSYYRGIRWLILLRELFYAPFTLYALLRLKKRARDFSIIHINECNVFAALPVKILLKKPVVMHARSLLETEKGRMRKLIIATIMRKFVDAVIAIDYNVFHTIPAIKDKVKVIHNVFYPSKLKAKAVPGWPNQPGIIRVALVSNLLKSKGIFEFIEAAKICQERHLNIKFLIIGGNIRNIGSFKNSILKMAGFDQDIRAEVLKLINQYNLGNMQLFDFVFDIKKVYDNIEVLAFPSHLGSVGRPVIEAAFSKVPSVVAMEESYNDTIINGKTGITIPLFDSQALADALESLTINPEKRIKMGEAAYQLALNNFSAKKNAAKVLMIYRQLLEESSAQ